MAIYYPSVAANLILRFDEALLSGVTPPPKTPAQGANSQLGGAGPAKNKAAMLSGTSDRLTQVLAIVPRNADIELPSFRCAPKFRMEFAFKDFPIDPRAMRAIGVEIYIGVVDNNDWSRGMRGQKDGPRLASQIQLKEENLMLAGVVDNIDVEHGERGSSVTLSGQGLQAVFLAAKLQAAQLAKLDLKQPLDKCIAQLLAMDAQGNGIPINIVAEEWPHGVPVPAAQELVTRAMKGADGEKSAMAMKGDPNGNSVWDKITFLCNLVGAIPYFIGHNLWIRPARSIYDQKNAGQLGQTPFAGGRPRNIKTGNNSVQINFRKMVYGRNLSSYKLSRKFGSTSVPTIRCICVDTSADVKGKDRLLEVQHPPEGSDGARTTAVDPSGKAARTEFLTIPICGIKDKTRLLEIAKQIYEEVGRGELSGCAMSKDLASLGGDNTDADILRLRPGDAVEFLVDAAGVQSIPPVVSELNQTAAQSDADAVQQVAARLGGRQDLAEVLVGAARGRFQSLQNVFRVSTVRYTWEMGTGIGVTFDFHNYVTARADVAGGADASEVGDFSSSGKQPTARESGISSGAARRIG